MDRRTAALLAVLLAACFDESAVGGDDDDDDTSGGSSEIVTTEASETSGSNGEGTSTSAADESSTSSGDTPDTTGPTPVCGDGTIEGDEPCDDMNADELDGCTQACELGPRAIALTPVASPPTAGDGTIAFEAPCPQGLETYALGELFGHRGGAGPDNAWTVSAGGTCSGLRLVDDGGTGAIQISANQVELVEQGNTVGQIDQWALPCPAGSVAVGVDARIFSGATPNIVALQLQCAVPRLVESDGTYSVVIDPPVPTGWTMSMTHHAEESSTCPAGAIAVGFRGRIDSGATAIYAMGVACAMPSVIVGPPE